MVRHCSRCDFTDLEQLKYESELWAIKTFSSLSKRGTLRWMTQAINTKAGSGVTFLAYSVEWMGQESGLMLLQSIMFIHFHSSELQFDKLVPGQPKYTESQTSTENIGWKKLKHNQSLLNLLLFFELGCTSRSREYYAIPLHITLGN